MKKLVLLLVLVTVVVTGGLFAQTRNSYIQPTYSLGITNVSSEVIQNSLRHSE